MDSFSIYWAPQSSKMKPRKESVLPRPQQQTSELTILDTLINGNGPCTIPPLHLCPSHVEHCLFSHLFFMASHLEGSSNTNRTMMIDPRSMEVCNAWNKRKKTTKKRSASCAPPTFPSGIGSRAQKYPQYMPKLPKNVYTHKQKNIYVLIYMTFK